MSQEPCGSTAKATSKKEGFKDKIETWYRGTYCKDSFAHLRDNHSEDCGTVQSMHEALFSDTISPQVFPLLLAVQARLPVQCRENGYLGIDTITSHHKRTSGKIRLWQGVPNWNGGISRSELAVLTWEATVRESDTCAVTKLACSAQLRCWLDTVEIKRFRARGTRVRGQYL